MITQALTLRTAGAASTTTIAHAASAARRGAGKALALACLVGCAALSGCGPADDRGPAPNLAGLRTALRDDAAFADVSSADANYWENDLGQGTLKVTLTVGRGGSAEQVSEDALRTIWTRYVTDRVRVIDVIVLGTANASFTIQQRYTLPGQADELTEKYGPSAAPG